MCIPTVSVVMLIYNHEKYCAQAIESVLNQKCSFSYEIVIGEDNSTDSSASIVHKYSQAYRDTIRVITSNTNVGMIPNFVRTIFSCKGKYIAICDGDDYWTDPCKLQKQVDVLDSYNDYGLVHTDCDLLYDASGKLISSINKRRMVDYSTYPNPFTGILIGDYRPVQNSFSALR